MAKIDRLIELLSDGYKTVSVQKYLGGILIGLSVLLTGLAVITWAESRLYMLPATKTVSIGLVLFLALAIAARYALRTGGTGFTRFYHTISERTGLPAVKHALDLHLASRDRTLKLYRSAIRKNLESIPWDSAEPRIKEEIRSTEPAIRFRQSLGVLAVAAAIAIFSGISHSGALQRSLSFWKQYEKPNPYTFTVTPGSVTIEQESTVRPAVEFENRVPGELLLGLKTDIEEKYRFRPMQATGAGSYASDPITLSSDASYFIKMDGFESERYKVNVQLKPRFESLTAAVIPPVYTGLDSTNYDYPFSQVRGYQGSGVTIRGRTNKQVETLHIISSLKEDSTQIEVTDSRHFTYEMEMVSPDSIYFDMRDRSGLKNKNPFKIAIEPHKDQFPFVQVTEPSGSLELSNPETVRIEYEASDDFGLTSAALKYELKRAFVNTPVTGSVELKTPAANTPQSYEWDLETLDTKPRDVITYRIEVTDNDGYNGPKTSSSRELTITFPSLVENLENVEQKESDIKESLEDISESYDKMREEYDRFKESLKENPDTGYEQQQMLEDVKEKQQGIDKKVEELNKKFEEIRREINENKFISEETRRMYEELQNLMNEIDDPELLKALEELQKAMGKLNQQQLRKALEEFEFSEEQYRERLNRTLELFKALKLNSDLEKMATALEKLAEKEKELSESGSSPSEQAEQQEAIKKDADKVSEQLEKLDEDPPKRSKEQLDDLQEESRQRMESIKEELRKNIEQLKKQRDGQNGQQQEQSKQQQRQIQQQMQQMAQKMRSAKQQLNRRRMQVNMAALQHILYNLVNLSEEQEELTQKTEYLANRSQAFVEKARVEKNISEQFTQVSDSLFAVSSEIPTFGNRINAKKNQVKRDLDLAVKQLAERNKSQSTYAQRQSLGGINELASMVASLIDQLQNQQQSGMGGGMSMQQFMEQLQNMSGDQQKLNQQIQNFINDIQGERLTKDQIDRLNQLARQQNEIRKQLREMQQNGNLESGDRLLSELERMAEEMEETINDLRGGQTDRLLIERQQNILSRMLNAEKAIQERDKEEKREGSSAEEAPNAVPPDVTLEELQQKIRKMLNDPEQTPFSEDYQKLIEQYFELLKKLQEEKVSS